MSLQERWNRRSVLGLGLGLGATGLLVASTSASAASITVNQLTFDVPGEFRTAPPDAELGRDWKWSAVRGGRPDSRPAAVILARADLDSTAPEEIFGLLLAPSVLGRMPDLQLGNIRTRPMTGGSASRLEVTYAVTRGLTYHGAILAMTRPKQSAGVLAVLGDDTLTAGTIDRVLDSARWLS